LKAQNRVGELLKIQPPKEWKDGIRNRIVLEPYKKRYIRDSDRPAEEKKS
jgi:hypothetical protein